jgi:hypothetical protein
VGVMCYAAGRMKTLLQALGVGAIVSLGMFGLGWLAVLAGNVEPSYFLYWPGKLLEGLVPCDNIGHELYPVCRVTTMNMVAFYAGIPLGIVVYALLAWPVLRIAQRFQKR